MTRNIYVGLDHWDGGAKHHPITSAAITFAAPRTGKGACQIIPTLRNSWLENIISVDPKGETILETAPHREALGQQVISFDPIPDPDTGKFLTPQKYRHTFNPLDLVRDGAGWRDLMMIADGLVHDDGQSSHRFFDSTGQTLIAGLIAFLLEKAEPERRNLGEIPRLLRALNDPEKRAGLLKSMDACTKYGELACDAAALVKQENNASDSIVKTAADNLKWLADEHMRRFLSSSSFDLNCLRTDPTSIYLVLPPDALEQHGTFLRLFVRCALGVMKRGHVEAGKSTNRPCLFVLDEFAKLGKIQVVSEDAGLMPGYGVHLWPILQGYGQLLTIYGQNGAEIFLNSASLITAFGLSQDERTAQLVSNLCGVNTLTDVQSEINIAAHAYEESERIRMATKETGGAYYQAKLAASGGGWFFGMGSVPIVANQTALAQLNAARGKIDRPRITSDEARRLTSVGANGVAQNLFAFFDGTYKIYTPSPHFKPAQIISGQNQHLANQAAQKRSDRRAKSQRTIEILALWVVGLAALLMVYFDT